MHINILAGGPTELLPNLKEYLGENEVWVGVDRGVYSLINMNITPKIAFGDFDSVTNEEYKVIEKHVKAMKRYKPEKNETDMELALNWAIKQKPDLIRIFGASGGRLDHFLANVQLLVKPLLEDNHVEIFLIDNQNILSLKGPGSYKMRKRADKKYVSFVPLTLNVKGLTLEGFKYPLKDRHITIGSTLCISNELISDNGTFSFSEGILLVIRSND
ncbi:thiamine diphosphokinase [Neobacillus sp. YX16]|uniref:thiamine diphosphokinase n=1 Tax=Neobacillus sp. YX16 TaxID=3047874 RepID=UPI0010599D56|nr:thiamine diphosphokinase [Neobacillus sp. YX16]TDL72587.1 thiamine diphosphokinase [Rhodococcus qingshengii]WHZ04800.1 thiamine diphosphokinase [Neobacillus sp. YX16]